MFNFLLLTSLLSRPPWVMSLLPFPGSALQARTQGPKESPRKWVWSWPSSTGVDEVGRTFLMQGRAQRSGVAQVGSSSVGRKQAWEALNARLKPTQSPGALSDCSTKMGMEMESEPG